MASLRPEEAVKGRHIRVLSSFLRRFIHTHTHMSIYPPAYLSVYVCVKTVWRYTHMYIMCVPTPTYMHKCIHTHMHIHTHTHTCIFGYRNNAIKWPSSFTNQNLALYTKDNYFSGLCRSSPPWDKIALPFRVDTLATSQPLLKPANLRSGCWHFAKTFPPQIPMLLIPVGIVPDPNGGRPPAAR